MSRIRSIFQFLLLVAVTFALLPENEALAAKGRIGGNVVYKEGEGESKPAARSGATREAMMLDLSYHYLRDTKADGQTDSAGRFSVGGMFNEWIGLDLQGLFGVRSKSYLVGADIRLVPNEWFFLKGGVGGYSRKETNELAFSPLAGAGINVRLGPNHYFVTETSYFSVNDSSNISFGVGLGVLF